MEFGGHCVLTRQGFSVFVAFSLNSIPPSLGLTLFQPVGKHLTLLGEMLYEGEGSLIELLGSLVKESFTIYQVALSCLGLIGAPEGLHWVVSRNVSDHI